jgi:hypothetical protein
MFRIVVATALGVVLAIPSVTWAVEILKEEPPKNSLPRGKIVYVDDGTCPAGMIKEVTGGNQDRGLPRKVRCIKRPE